MPIKFPKDFLFGTSTSAYQIEGNNKNCDWWKLEQARKLPYKSGKACNFWQKWKSDIELMSKLGYDVFRFSLEWSRVIPKKEKINENALEKYSKIVAFCHQKEIKPLVTLWHFTLPQWFAKLGGFEYRENLQYWKDYVKAVVDKLGNKVELWGTMNEPSIHAYFSYLERCFPPFKSDPDLYKRVLGNYFLAYSQSYRLIKKKNRNAFVGPVLSTTLVEPVPQPTKDDLKAAKKADKYFNGYQYETFENLRLPKELGRNKISGADYLGINYYMRRRIRYDPRKPAGFAVDSPPALAEISEMGWEVYPEGFLKILKRYSKIGKPIIVTENGISTYKDEQRCHCILRHLLKLKKALEEGLDIRGYFYWSFLDNFEWVRGFRQKFGLIKVDYKNFEREPRRSAKLFSKISKKKAISREMLEKFKIEM